MWDTFSKCVPTATKAQKVAVASYKTGKVTWPGVSAGKRPWDACQRQQMSQASTVSLHRSVVTVATTKSKAATVWRELVGVKAEVMLDSGSSVSLVQEQMLS